MGRIKVFRASARAYAYGPGASIYGSWIVPNEADADRLLAAMADLVEVVPEEWPQQKPAPQETARDYFVRTLGG